MEHSGEFKLGALKNLEPALQASVRQYRNRSKKQKTSSDKASSCHGGGDEKLSEVLAKIASLQKAATGDGAINLVRTYNVKLRLKKTLYKCFDCNQSFTNAEFLEMHENSHATSGTHDTSGPGRDIDLKQQSFDESEMNLKQNAWFTGDFSDTEEDGDEIMLDCTVEEREDNYDITFDRNKCEKTYTVKYKVKKEVVGKCERCEKVFYSSEALELHKVEHEKFIDFAAIEPTINIDSPKIEESTFVLDENFFQVLSEMDASDILEVSESDVKRSPSTEIRLEYKIVPRRTSKDTHQQSPEPQQTPLKAPEGRFQCDICAKRFRFRPALTVHARTHDNSRPFRCEECGRRFISRAKLFLHAYGHRREDEAAIRCERCGREGFARPKQLLEHMIAEHGKQ
ncbi:zinc finger protein 90 isoform X1 [Culex quinquefasciatus]|uniref:zinc finger protein 90 isoform X1 n=1 Tax=Culex quinquefasciatus TaxID=7176 RepID=UPI0018E33AD6|nr:zinc finger protein 90 isoform X1 [Culex quinquefasciatus]